MPVTKKSEDHCRSYYAATANELASYPVLEGGGKIGVNVTHIAGEVVADAICGTMERFDLLAKIKRHRLPLGQWFSGQIIALGMLYYRMRDLI